MRRVANYREDSADELGPLMPFPKPVYDLYSQPKRPSVQLRESLDNAIDGGPLSLREQLGLLSQKATKALTQLSAGDGIQLMTLPKGTRWSHNDAVCGGCWETTTTNNTTESHKVLSMHALDSGGDTLFASADLMKWLCETTRGVSRDDVETNHVLSVENVFVEQNQHTFVAFSVAVSVNVAGEQHDWRWRVVTDYKVLPVTKLANV